MPKSVSQAVTEFWADEAIGRLAQSTQKRQRLTINRLLKYVDPKGPASRINRLAVNMVLNEVRGTVEESSLNAYRSDLRRFGAWLVQNDFTLSDPAAHLRSLPVVIDPKKRKPLNAGKARQVVAVAKAIHPRDGMTALLMLASGLRESEIVNLQWGNVDEDFNKIDAMRFKTKQNLPVHVTPQLRTELQQWKAFYEEKHGPIQNDWYVVPALVHRSRKPGFLYMNPEWPMQPKAPQHNLGTRVKTWLAGAGEKNLKGRASHTLRRTAANILRDQCNDIRVVQTFLGHKDVRMTELYLDIDIAQEKLRQTVQTFEI